MIAIALALKPRLVIADEPTTALDVTVQAQVLRLLSEMQRRSGMALIMISHDLGVVAKVADRIAVMYAGRIVETGSTAQICGSPAHPYTSGLIGSLPTVGQEGQDLPFRSRVNLRTPETCPTGVRSVQVPTRTRPLPVAGTRADRPRRRQEERVPLRRGAAEP